MVFDYPDMDGTNPQVIRAAVRTLKMVQRAGGVPMLSYVWGRMSARSALMITTWPSRAASE